MKLLSKHNTYITQSKNAVATDCNFQAKPKSQGCCSNAANVTLLWMGWDL